ncbi:MAG: hypothetical protein OSA89_19390, partial [Mariniblastus sp.]|nr:hypothetical protein [Mariniblastus sp.]
VSGRAFIPQRFGLSDRFTIEAPRRSGTGTEKTPDRARVLETACKSFSQVTSWLFGDLTDWDDRCVT